jgi:hypothetical protein
MCPFTAKGSFNRNRRWEYLELSTVPIDDCLCKIIIIKNKNKMGESE